MGYTFDELISMNTTELEAVLARGSTPKFSDLVGFEFRGWNVFADALSAGVGTVMGIQRFAKGFFQRPASPPPDEAPWIEGFNVKIRRGGAHDEWTYLGPGEPVRHGFYRVLRAQEGDNRKGRHPHALLLDYSLGQPRPSLFQGGGLRDFIVHPDPSNRDLLLGKAYMHVGPLVSVAGFFVAERLRPHTFQAPTA